MADVGFTLNDLFEFFALKGGKVVYSEIVTNFKSALSNPETLAEARNQFKDHVNTLATVTNENGTKYLVLRPKFMKKLAALADESFHNNHASSRTAAVAAEMIPIVPNSAAVSNSSNVPQKQPPPPPSQPSQPVLPPQAQYPQYPLPQAHSQPQYHHHHHHHHSNGSNGANHFEAPAAQIATRPSHLMMMNNGASSVSSNSVMGTPSSNYNHHHHHPHLHQQSQNIHHQQQQQQQHQHLQQSFPGDSAPRNVPSSAPLPPPLPLPSVSFSPLTGSSNGNHSMAEGSSTTCTTPMTPGDSPDGSEAPPRPPPRKKASFSKQSRPTPPPPPSATIHQASAGAAPVQTPPEGAPPAPSAENQENQKPLPPTPQVNGGTLEKKKNHTVKKEIQELARTPGRVKEHAQILNKLALTTDQPQKLPLPPTTTSATTFTGSSVHANVVAKIRSGFHGGGTASGNDSDSGSIQIIDTLKKRWIIAASNCDYAELVALLKEDANLAAYGDFITGFTALHWAAKFNRPNIIKLLVGRYGIDPNVRSFSGSTPLHLAAQFRHQAIVQLLTEVYGAKEDIRDNYGKKALQYLETGDQTAKYEGKYGGGGDHTDHHHHHHLKSNGQNNGGPWSVNGGSSSGGKGGSSTTAANENGGGSGSSGMTPKTSIMSLRNKISHQSMLVRNKFRQSKAIVQKRKSSFSNK